LLVAVVWVLATPQEQQLREDVLRFYLVEVREFLECAADVLLDQVFHFLLCCRLVVFVGFRGSQWIEILHLLSYSD